MNKKILVLVFTVLLALTFSVTAFAAENEASDLGNYIEQKIVPVVIGVATALIGLFATLRQIFKALSELKGTKEALSKAQNEIKEQSNAELLQMKKKYDEILAVASKISTQGEQIKALALGIDTVKSQISNLSEIAYLGFSENQELVRSGKSREIAILSGKNQIKENEYEE